MAGARGCSAAWATQVARLAVAGAGVCRLCDAWGEGKTAEVAGVRGCSATEYCTGAGAAAEYCTGAEECVVGSTAPVRRGSGATGARPTEVYCKGAGAEAEYCTGAEECVEGSTAPVRRRGLSYRGETRGIRPWVETQVCKVTINCGYRCVRDRVSHLLKFRGRVISAIRYSVGARMYLPVIPSFMIRTPRMVAVRGPRDEWREGRVLLPERRSGAMKTAKVDGARAGLCCRSGAGLASCRSHAGFGCRAPERFKGRSRYNSLSPRWRPSGVSAAWAGPTASILKGPVQYSEFSL